MLGISKTGILMNEDGRKRIHISETVSTVKKRDKNAAAKYKQFKAVAELPGGSYEVVVKTYLHTDEEGKERRHRSKCVTTFFDGNKKTP